MVAVVVVVVVVVVGFGEPLLAATLHWHEQMVI